MGEHGGFSVPREEGPSSGSERGPLPPPPLNPVRNTILHQELAPAQRGRTRWKLCRARRGEGDPTAGRPVLRRCPRLLSPGWEGQLRPGSLGSSTATRCALSTGPGLLGRGVHCLDPSLESCPRTVLSTGFHGKEVCPVGVGGGKAWRRTRGGPDSRLGALVGAAGDPRAANHPDSLAPRSPGAQAL